MISFFFIIPPPLLLSLRHPRRHDPGNGWITYLHIIHTLTREKEGAGGGGGKGARLGTVLYSTYICVACDQSVAYVRLGYYLYYLLLM